MLRVRSKITQIILKSNDMFPPPLRGRVRERGKKCK